MAGIGGVPADGAAAVVANVTIEAPAAAGWAKVNRQDGTWAAAATLHYQADATVNDVVVAQLDEEGYLSVYTEAAADVIIDVSGWYSPVVGTFTYTYGPDGLRASKTDNTGVTTTYTWDRSGPLPLLIAETTGTATTRFTYGPDGRPLAQHNPDGSVVYLHADQLGSVRMLTDAGGDTVGTYNYGPYGNLADHTGTAATPFGFAGEYTDAETGFQYLRARYYDPATGQFLTRDPIEAITRSPYAYVNGNPLNATDPSGLYWGEGFVNGAIDVGTAVVNAPATAVAVVANTATGGDCGMAAHLTVVCEGGALSDANPNNSAFTLGSAINVDTDYVDEFRNDPDIFEHELAHVRQYGFFNAFVPGGTVTYLELYGLNSLVSQLLCGEECYNVFEWQAGFGDGDYPCDGFGDRR